MSTGIDGISPKMLKLTSDCNTPVSSANDQYKHPYRSIS